MCFHGFCTITFNGSCLRRARPSQIHQNRLIMGMEKTSFRREDEDDEVDDVQNELLDDDDGVAVIEPVVGNNALEPEPEAEAETSNDDFSDSDADSESDSDSDYSPNNDNDNDADADGDANAESETDSVKSLRIGRETRSNAESSSDDILLMLRNGANSKKLQPPDILNDDAVTDISFSPTHDIIAVATAEGDIYLYSYDVENTQVALKYSAHMGSCRRIEFDDQGESIYSISDDKCIIVADANSGKFKNVFDDAHSHPIYSLLVINDNLFSTGDDEGHVKLWDKRRREQVFSLKVGADYVSSLKCLDEASTLVCTAGDGVVSVINMNSRKLANKSQPYDAELTCSDLFCSNTKLAVGTTTGALLMYSWGEFSSWNDEFPGVDDKKHAINCMIPVTENIVVTGMDDGLLRATNLFPMRHVGIVGQHGGTVECIDINADGTLLASASIDNKVRFWNVEYFEDIHITDKMASNNNKAREHNLPSSYGQNSTDFYSGLS
ncbi:WD repeat-containing protein 55 homolog isoform X2 [Planococcus citri]|uniref:WD repeat-containing protein 55 homolog isoform X2 n=1 Tax=Planococcus citri TaxID=170843 RepID=UPI0031FA1923